jgi:two-component system, response regulator YesN
MSRDFDVTYRFLIIDDEPVVREGIAQNIDWPAHGFELVGACRDGREGMEAIEHLHPDVVLTDICMPFVDGLELASFVTERYPSTKTILLTGYDEFEYAQEAIKLKVHDFLLKPITADELRAKLDALREEIDTERARQSRLETIRVQVAESLPLLRERLLNRLVRTASTMPEIKRKLTMLDLELRGPWFAALICDVDSPDGAENELNTIACQNAVVDVTSACDAAVGFATPNDQMVVIVSGAGDRDAESRALECAEAVSDRAARSFGMTISVGVGGAAEGIEGLPQTYRDARTALEHRLVLGPGQIITVRQARGDPIELVETPERPLRKEFADALATGERALALSSLDRLLEWYRSGECSIESCSAGMHRLLAGTLETLDALGIDPGTLPEIGRNPFGELERLKTLDEMRTWFHTLAAGVCTHLDRRREDASHVKATSAERYIRDRHADSGLSLTQVCRDLAVSKSCFSPLFKTHTGMTFVEYLTAVRMEHAKELLSGTDLLTYEVAERVGFNDPHYFSLTFRKQCGLSPTEYRQSRVQI